MKEFDTIFLENLEKIGDLLRDQNYASAFKSIGAITQFCSITENAQGVFVSEILEGVFYQVGPIIDNIQLPKEDAEELAVNLHGADIPH